MKIAVCISCVPDTTTKIKFTDNNTKFDANGVQWIINPWDELALTRALELKENENSTIESITVLNVGTQENDAVLRKCLALGADKGIRVNKESNEAYQVAVQLSEVVKKEKFDLVLFGIESSDYNDSAVGAMVAELLDLDSISSVSSLNIENKSFVVERENDNGKEKLESFPPLVLVVQKGIAIEPRIPSMRGIMMARKKPLIIQEPIDCETQTEFMFYEPIKTEKNCKYIDPENPGELIELLHKEAKII